MLIKALTLIQTNEVTETAYGFSKPVRELQFPSPLSCRKNLCVLWKNRQNVLQTLHASLASHSDLPSYMVAVSLPFYIGHCKGSRESPKLQTNERQSRDSSQIPTRPPTPSSALEFWGLSAGITGPPGQLCRLRALSAAPTPWCSPTQMGREAKLRSLTFLLARLLLPVYSHHHPLGLALGIDLGMTTPRLKSQLPTSHPVAPTSCLSVPGAGFLPATTELDLLLSSHLKKKEDHRY